MKVSRERPIERCNECGNVVKLHYDGPEEDPHARMSFPFFFFFFFVRLFVSGLHFNSHSSHAYSYILHADEHHDEAHGHGHHHPPYEEPKSFADFVKPEYWYR